MALLDPGKANQQGAYAGWTSALGHSAQALLSLMALQMQQQAPTDPTFYCIQVGDKTHVINSANIAETRARLRSPPHGATLSVLVFQFSQLPDWWDRLMMCRAASASRPPDLYYKSKAKAVPPASHWVRNGLETSTPVCPTVLRLP